MKRLFVIVFCVIVFALIMAGCQLQSDQSLSTDEKSGADVFIEGGGQFPQFLVGTWKAETRPWKIVLSSDGTVSSAIIPMGKVEVRPNQTTKVEMKDGQYSTYKAGDFEVTYNPADKELFVSIEILEYHIIYLHNVIDGNSIDRFVGEVTEDGEYWMADWIGIFDYGPRFPQDQNDISVVPLVFKKIEE